MALLASVIAGAVHPGSALLLANIINQQFNIYPNSVISTSLTQVATDISSAENYVLGVFILAIFIFFPFMVQSTLFTIVGESMTEKIRTEVYHKLLRLPV
jgi:uncharacterized membrane protein YfcA